MAYRLVRCDAGSGFVVGLPRSGLALRRVDSVLGQEMN